MENLGRHQPIHPEDGEKEQPNQEERAVFDWAEYATEMEREGKERERVTEDFFKRINYGNLKLEAVQELEQKGLYSKNEHDHFLLSNPWAIESIVICRKLGRRLEELAGQLQGAEKEQALQLSSESLARAFYEMNEYRYQAKQNDRGMERYNGELTALSSLNALEILRRFDIIGVEEFETEKRQIISAVESELREERP